MSKPKKKGKNQLTQVKLTAKCESVQSAERIDDCPDINEKI